MPLKENVLRWSEDFSNALWGKVNFTGTGGTTPDPNGDNIPVYTLGNNGYLTLDSTVALSAGALAGNSVWLKRIDSSTPINVGFRKPGGGSFAENIVITVTGEWQYFFWHGASLGTIARWLLDNRTQTGVTGAPMQIAVWRAQQWRGDASKRYVKTEDSVIQDLYVRSRNNALAGMF